MFVRGVREREVLKEKTRRDYQQKRALPTEGSFSNIEASIEVPRKSNYRTSESCFEIDG
jgi:hypothetical protein